ncbi:hypothetical protein BGW42_006936 [Actinomortierella wolfii]|nr:hypothetical protein BGW42_006936 [Actinomortierella wolfii]
MRFNFSIASALFVVLSTTAVAAETKKGYKVPIRTFHGPVRPSTVGRWMHALRKYNLRPRKTFSGRNKGYEQNKGDSATNLARVPLVDYDFDREYYGTVIIGEPPQSFKIDFDTGSSQFIISTKGCDQCSGDSHYDPTLSSTFQPDGQEWHITYGDMSHAEGLLGHDDVLIDDIRVTKQQLAMAYSESAGFDDTIDGIMGLAFGSLSSSISSTKTVFENMMAQNLVEKGIFSFYLGKASLQGGGEVMFGGLDMSRVAPGHNITYTPVTKAKYWQIDVRGVYVNGRKVPNSISVSDASASKKGMRGSGHRGAKGNKKREISNDEPIPGIMDTGTTLMVVPYKIARGIHRKIKGAQELSQSWAVPCHLAELEPEGVVEFDIEGKRFKIPFEDIVREETDRPGLCFSGIQMNPANFMIIGDLFIKNNYVVFDMEKKRVGIAPLNLQTQPPPVEQGVQASVEGEQRYEGDKIDELNYIQDEGDANLEEDRLQQLFRHRWGRVDRNANLNV